MDFNRRGGLKFVDRGDVANYDFQVGVLTTDDAWHDIDLSGIVPANAKLVRIKTHIKANIVGAYFEFMKAGYTGNKNTYATNTGSTAYQNVTWSDVPIGSDGIIQYRGNNVSWNNIDFCVMGWLV